LFLASFASAQTKKPADKPGKNNKATAKKDSVVPVVEETVTIPRNFSVYSRKAKTGKDRSMKLCINLVKDTTVLNYCLADSLCKNPEVSKILFEQQSGDTNYVLVFVDAFSKPDDKPGCDAGKETKLFFARWNLKTNKATWKQKTVSSCMRGIDNMTKEPITDWDKTSVLTINYYRGSSQFLELKFDPANYKLGMQSATQSNTSADPESK
jgi:hypothetical protein